MWGFDRDWKKKLSLAATTLPDNPYANYPGSEHTSLVKSQKHSKRIYLLFASNQAFEPHSYPRNSFLSTFTSQLIKITTQNQNHDVYAWFLNKISSTLKKSWHTFQHILKHPIIPTFYHKSFFNIIQTSVF